MIKLLNFLSRNTDAPFSVKKKVFDSALLTSLLYNCESWFDSPIDKLHSMFLVAIKSLLGVRKTTPNDLCLLECGYPPLKYYVKELQSKFFLKIRARDVNDEDPLFFAMNLHREAMTPTAQFILDIELCTLDYMNVGLEYVRNSVRRSDRSKFITYLSLNPELSVHPVYSNNVLHVIPEFKRITFSRLRLSAHNLKIETGRWNRTPRENRLCECGEIQTESHILTSCPLTEPLRLFHNAIATFVCPDIFHFPPPVLIDYVFDCYTVFA